MTQEVSEMLQKFKELDLSELKPLDENFWENHYKEFNERVEKRQKEQDSIKMSYEKYHKPFTI